MRQSLFSLTAWALLALLAAPSAHAQPPGGLSRLGTVSFATSCDKSVRPEFNRAVALLHSFWYEAAEAAFAQVAEKDPSCGLAHCGVAIERLAAIRDSVV